MNTNSSGSVWNNISAALLLAVVVATTSLGCQKQSDLTAEDVPAGDTSMAAVDVPEQVTETPPPESETDEPEQHADAEHEHASQGMGKGRGGRGMGRGRMGGFRPDMTTIHAMFAASDKIKRTVKKLSNGAEATTESDDEDIVALIQEHVPAMERRVMNDSPLPPMTFHPIFVNLIKHSKDYTLKFEDTEKGTKVVYKAEDPFVVMLVQEHAKLVSRFLKNGMSEIHKPYTLPKVGSDEARSDKKKKALSAKKALFQKLSTRLVQAMSDGGPANAIEVCSKDAAKLAAEVGDKLGVTIGRTSFKLRNPKNAPPAWAAQFVTKRTGEPTFVNLPDKKLGAMLPIRLMPQCMTCHGPKENIDDEVLVALADQYPDDQATGFKVDDLRGWFWVEVP
ncbi:MAG: DUF3365 domain-containing protein [Planctomycetaceae bacterium]